MGFTALYDLRLWTGRRLFLQPWSQHDAYSWCCACLTACNIDVIAYVCNHHCLQPRLSMW